MLFLPNDDAAEAESRKIAEEAISAEGLTVLGWRDVPVEPSVVGRLANVSEPRIVQVVVRDTSGHTGEDLERVLFLVRKGIEKRRRQLGGAVSDLYVCSLSTLVRSVFWLHASPSASSFRASMRHTVQGPAVALLLAPS